MATDDQGNYYYDAGTVNEQLDDFEVYERDGRLFFNNEADGAATALLGNGVGFPGQRGAPANSAFDNVDQRALYIADGNASSSSAGDLVLARADGSGGVEEAVIASPGAFASV
jgi:hypothetical protein